MELTPRELKKIECLRKQERLWPRNRWIILAVGIAIDALYGCLLVFYFHQLFPPETDSSQFGDMLSRANILMFAMFWPKFLLAFCFSTWVIIVAIRDWHGNINRILLLKLLDAQQSASAVSAKTS